jgi:hypothetical protein
LSTLPAAPWTRREDLAALVAALGQGTLRWVGGAVRDTLLDLPVKDIDAATTHRPEQVVALCKTAGIRTVPTGIAHGTVTAILPGGPVEVTTLRHDVSTDGRRATVAFASDWREDAARRDFTINALYADPLTLEIADFFGGEEDLARRRVRFIGDARQRIREDHLRILRYFRFQARFGAMADGEAEAACHDLANTLKGLSRERVAAELLAILGLPDPVATVERMQGLGVLPVVLPEADAGGLATLASVVEAEARFGAAPSALRRMAALLPPIPRWRRRSRRASSCRWRSASTLPPAPHATWPMPPTRARSPIAPGSNRHATGCSWLAQFMSYFSDLGLAEPILRALEAKGYADPTPIQRQAIPALLEGRDLLGIAQTGTGKTAAFSLPSLHRLAANPRAASPPPAACWCFRPPANWPPRSPTTCAAMPST